MKNYSALIFLFVLTFVFAGCEKEKEAEPTKEETLMAKNWKLTSGQAVPSGAAFSLDIYSFLIDCQKDNLLKFNTGGVVVFDEGATKCTPNAPQQAQGTWSLQQNATGDVLMVNGNILVAYGLTTSSARNLKVETLTNQTLKVNFEEAVTVPGATAPVPAKIDLTFTAQ